MSFSQDIQWWIEILLSLITAAAAILVAVIAHRYTRRQSTLSAVAQLSKIIAPLDRKLSEVAPRDIVLTPKDGDSLVDSDVAPDLIEFLNAYEEFSLSILAGVVDEKIAQKLRRESVLGTAERFRPFIQSWRTRYGRSEAWHNLLELELKWRQTTR